MKRIFLILTYILFCLIGINNSFAMTAKEVIIENSNRYRYIGTESAKIYTNTKRNGKISKRTFDYWVKFINNNVNNPEDITVTVVTTPVNKAGLGIRTNRKDGKATTFIKKRTQNKLRKISSKRKGAYFSWTAIEEEDFKRFTGEMINNFKWKFSKNFSKNEENGYYIIEAIPNKKVDTAYSKRIIWINKKNFSTHMIEYYKHGKKSKLQTNIKIKIFDNGIWRVDIAEFEDKIAGKTILTITDRKMKAKLSGKYFKKSFLLIR